MMKHLFSIWILLTVLTFGLKAQVLKLDTLVDFTFDGITLKQAIQEIEQQYHIRFSYSDSKIQVNKIVNASYVSWRLDDILRDILHSNGINYSLIENQIVLFPQLKNQNIVLQGKVIDELTDLPIPYVHISIAGTSKGTSSNEDGEFEIGLMRLPSELMISHLAHEKKLVYVYNESEDLEIKLLPSPIALQQITIKAKRNKNANYQLIKKAYERLSKTDSGLKYGKAFYRQKSQRNEKYTEIFELFYDIKYTTTGIKDWAVQEGRYAFQNDNDKGIFIYNKNFTLLSRLFSTKQPEIESYLIPVNRNVKKLFDLELKEVIKFDQRYIGIITYQPKSIISQAAAKGELYIDIDSYQILQIKGTFTDPSLGIIAFNDNQSTWDKYQLDFQISFIDAPSDRLLMDFVQINHGFDYYFKKEYIGKINTSSILTFYEHYTPVKTKKLGGVIDYKTSDMEVIDGIGYNASFWSQNPIVKRTPIEEGLIKDFEQNEAFGVVFLNNDEEVVLLPDNKYDKKASTIIARFESLNHGRLTQKLYLRLDKNNYVNGDKLRFAGYLIDKVTLKPYVVGSVLTIEMYNQKRELALREKFEINEGLAYGELEIPELTLPGKYYLKAYTNIQDGQPFEKEIYISQISPNAPVPYLDLEKVGGHELVVKFYPESGNILEEINTKIVFSVESLNGQKVKGAWQITDGLGSVLQSTETDQFGIGSFEISAVMDQEYFLSSDPAGNASKWMLPKAESSGISMKIGTDRTRSIPIELGQKPDSPKEIYLLTSANGKVFSYQEIQLLGTSMTADVPIQHLPGGINIVTALDEKGNLLCERPIYVNPARLTIQLESAFWKSKRANTMELKFKISDQNGKAENAYLSAVCSRVNQTECLNCDIRNYLYFHEHPQLENIDLSTRSDTDFSMLDDLLIMTNRNAPEYLQPTNAKLDKNEYSSMLLKQDHPEEPIFTEVSISGNYSAEMKSAKNQVPPKKAGSAGETYWIPNLEIDAAGIATIDYKIANKNDKLYVNIQGISNNGLIGSQKFTIDPRIVKAKAN